jgi:hypothetical protein
MMMKCKNLTLSSLDKQILRGIDVMSIGPSIMGIR